MKRTLVRAKIHGAYVSDSNPSYKGSISICPKLIRAAGLMPFELVHVNNYSNGAHWETYVIPGRTGEITLNGPPSRLFQAGDKIVILSVVELDSKKGELAAFEHRVVFVDRKNRITEQTKQKIPRSFLASIGP